MKTTTWSEKWLVKSVDRFPLSHKGVFSCSSVVSSLGLKWIVVGTTYLGVM